MFVLELFIYCCCCKIFGEIVSDFGEWVIDVKDWFFEEWICVMGDVEIKVFGFVRYDEFLVGFVKDVGEVRVDIVE